MAEIQLGVHTVKSHGVKMVKVYMYDWLILLLLVVIEILLNKIEPFHRFVGEDMMSTLKYPLKENTIPFWAVPVYSILLPLLIICIFYYYRRDVYDLHLAILGLLFSILITGVITDAIKDAVGRPRPDFFWRCFPDGVGVYHHITRDAICNGDKSVIKEGHKSFPSGHTSWSFAGLGYLSWYLAGKIKVFDRRGHAAKLCILFLPLLAAALVGVTCVDDYLHHWQDVFTGGVIGWAPHVYFHTLAERNGSQSSRRRANTVRNRRQETGSTLSDSDKETVESISPNSNLMMEAMEAGRKY